MDLAADGLAHFPHRDEPVLHIADVLDARDSPEIGPGTVAIPADALALQPGLAKL